MLVGLVYAGHAQAAVVEFAFDGTADGAGLPVFGINPAIGSTVTGTFSYDTALPTQPFSAFSAQCQIDSPYTLVAYIGGTSAPYVELRVPDAETEQEFLLLAVQAAVKKYRETQNRINPPQTTCDERCSLPRSAC